MSNITVQKRAPSLPLANTPDWEPFRVMRDLLRWDPFREMTPLFNAERTDSFVPSFEVKETKDGYQFQGDVPGIKEGDIDVSLSGNRLTISGKREAERQDERDTYYLFERSYGSFSRTFTLPHGADGEHVHAELKDGVLTVSLPKKPEVQSKKISVKTGNGPKS